MRQWKWYVYRIKGYLYRIRCEPWYINELYAKQAIDEYRTCESREEAIYLCCKFNKRRLSNEKI